MSDDRKIDLKELFKGLQGQMTATLNTSRSFITHCGSKGALLKTHGLNGCKTTCQTDIVLLKLLS